MRVMWGDERGDEWGSGAYLDILGVRYQGLWINETHPKASDGTTQNKETEMHVFQMIRLDPARSHYNGIVGWASSQP